MAMTAREIVDSIGMCSIPEYYSGRAAIWSDLSGNHIYGIYRNILTEFGAKAAQAFVTMVENLSYLSATNFLNALYALETKNWIYEPFEVSIMNVGNDDTIYIKNTFFKQIGKYSLIKPQATLDRRYYYSY